MLSSCILKCESKFCVMNIKVMSSSYLFLVVNEGLHLQENTLPRSAVQQRGYHKEKKRENNSCCCSFIMQNKGECII
ncbi:unnamed protein product [Moneuplotes crassus]|uniref:Uncharacterized protein n=1 Tax=Euplotes crassus TaxID=5936 RepID=A0AAD1XKW8_EUPCR|nr:unnamed protein product [Moneuplotes crassus]